MLAEADRGIFFCPLQHVIAEFPQFPVLTDYAGLETAFIEARAALE
jgi:phosphoserine / homoserine phosphotransferase